MANSANPEINKKIATSALGTLVIATVFFYLGDRYAETLVTYPGQIFDHLSDAFLSMWQTIKDAPFALDMTSNSLLFGGACFLIIWMIWLRYVAFIGNYRSGEESGSARWGTVKEGKKFKDLQTEDNNLLFTKNFGLALHRPKFDPEYDRNLNVLVVGGSGSGKTFNYVTPNICQLNTSYFVTDPKGTLLKDAGYLFTDNGYKLKSFNTINLDESMHYNPSQSRLSLSFFSSYSPAYLRKLSFRFSYSSLVIFPSFKNSFQDHQVQTHDWIVSSVNRMLPSAHGLMPNASSERKSVCMSSS